VIKHTVRDVLCSTLAPDQSLLATGTQTGAIFLWEVGSCTLLHVLSGGHTKDVTGLSFNKDATVLASVGEDGNLIWWMLSEPSPDGVFFRKLEGHNGPPISACVFAPNSLIMATGSKDCDVIIWGNLGRPISRRLRGHTNWVTCLAFSTDSDVLVSGSFDHSVCLWSTKTHNVIRIIRHHDTAVTAVVLSIEGSVLASGDEDGVVLLSRVSDGICLRVMRAHEDMISGLRFAENIGVVLSSSRDSTVKVWLLRGKCVKSFKAHKGGVLSLAVSLVDQMLVTTGDDFCARVFPFSWKEPKPGAPD
jgi:WD40 repeat protein